MQPEVADMLEVARKMRGPDGAGRVLVLDVEHSSTKHRIYLRERASRHAYYLRPPEGMHANDLKNILDDAGGEQELGFRYYVYPELHTDLKPVLTADPYAGKHFERDEAQRYLQIEGERPKARAAIAELLEGLKEPFNPADFPRINEFALKSFKPAAHGRQGEAVLLRRDGDRDELRKSEPGFHIAVAEHGFGKEIDIHRPVVGDTEPVLILTTNEHTTHLGHKFLGDLAEYFGSAIYAEQSALVKTETGEKLSAYTPSHIPAARIPRIDPPKMDERQLLARAAKAVRDQLPNMKLLRKREATQSGPHLTIRFPGHLGFGKGPSAKEVKEVEWIYRVLKGDPSFGSDWYAHYQVDDKTGDMRITTSCDRRAPSGWTTLRS